MRQEGLSEKKDRDWHYLILLLTAQTLAGLFCRRSFYIAGAVNKSQTLCVGGFVSPKMDAFLPSANMVLPVK